MKTIRRAAIAAAALVVLALCWLLIDESRPTGSSAAAPAAEAIEFDGASTVALSAPSELQRAVAAAAPEIALDERTPTSEGVQASSVRGRLHIAGYERRIAEAHAKLELRLTDSAQSSSRKASVRAAAGSFELPVEPGETLVLVDAIEVDGWFAEPLARELSFERDVELLIEARWREGVFLHVVDATSRVNLGDVTIVPSLARQGWLAALRLGSRPTSAMQEQPLVEHDASPVMLPAANHSQSLWVTAADHAWQRVEIGVGEGERTVALPLASKLLVRLPQAAPPQACRLNFVLTSGVGSTEVVNELLGIAPPREIEFDKLEPGYLHVVLECLRGQRGETAAETDLELRPGETTTWNVAWVAANARGSLRIVVDAGAAPLARFEEASFQIKRVSSHGEPVFDPDEQQHNLPRNADRAFRTTIGSLAPGTYEVAVEPWNQSLRVEVAAGAESLAEFDVARRVRMRVRVVDAISDEPIEHASVTYGPVLRGEFPEYWFSASRPSHRDFWELLVEPGRLRISVDAQGYGSQSVDHVVRDPDEELVVALHEAQDLPLSLTLKQGGTSVPLTMEIWMDVALESTPPGGAVTKRSFRSVGTSGTADSSVIFVSVPGVYVLRVPPSICGGTEDQLVQVEVTEPSGATVELQRQE